MTSLPHIAFEGLIGTGKTTLATRFAKYIGADLFLEQFENNQFLPAFYINPERWALPMQLTFLLSRHNAHQSLATSRDKALVSDYTSAKEEIFARLLLKNDDEYALYRQISVELNSGEHKSNAIIFLDAPNEVILRRIRARGRAYEQNIDAAYLDQIRDSYELHWATTDKNVIRIDASRNDLGEPEHLQTLYSLIQSSLPATTKLPNLR